MNMQNKITIALLLTILALLTLPSALLARDLEYVGLGRYKCSGHDCEEFNQRQERNQRQEQREIERDRRELERDLDKNREELTESSDYR